MGMTTKSGRYFANPAIGRAHEAQEGRESGKKPERDRLEPEHEASESAGGAHSVHVFRDEAGGHHTVVHHPGGVEHEEHGSLEEAMDHAHKAMSGEQEAPEEDEGAGAAPNGLMSTLGNGSY